MTSRRLPMTEGYRAEHQPAHPDVIMGPEQPSTRSKAVNWIVGGALAMIAASLLVFFSWALENENIIEVNNEPFPVRTIRNHPEPGGVVFLNVDMCKNTDAEGTLRTSFVSETREVFLPLQEVEMDHGCFIREIPVAIPNDIEPDHYRVEFRVEYSLNPLKQRVVDEFKSSEFIIAPLASQGGVNETNQCPSFR